MTLAAHITEAIAAAVAAGCEGDTLPSGVAG